MGKIFDEIDLYEQTLNTGLCPCCGHPLETDIRDNFLWCPYCGWDELDIPLF